MALLCYLSEKLARLRDSATEYGIPGNQTATGTIHADKAGH
jgi:hypothetical protein